MVKCEKCSSEKVALICLELDELRKAIQSRSGRVGTFTWSSDERRNMKVLGWLMENRGRLYGVLTNES